MWRVLATQLPSRCATSAPPRSRDVCDEAVTPLPAILSVFRLHFHPLSMKLHPFQRWALKLGVPLKLLNVFAQECYGYAIPNAEGKYPDWWYEEQRVPHTFRDCEVPKEVLKRRQGKKGKCAIPSPTVYGRVKYGQVVEIIGSTGVPSAPNLPRYRAEPAHCLRTPFTDPRFSPPREGYRNPEIKTEELISRGTEIRGFGLNRTMSSPLTPPTRGTNTMSFIRNDRMPSPIVVGMVDPGPLLHEIPPADVTFSHFRRNACTTGNRGPTGPPLPNSPRPLQPQHHPARNTNHSVLQYYINTDSSDISASSQAHRQWRSRHIRSVQEDQEQEQYSEWDSNEDEEGVSMESLGSWPD